MIAFKCKMCGGNLQPENGDTTCECEFCGTVQTIPTDDGEKKTNLFNRANHLRMNAEFDKAAAVYESIAAEFPEEAEAYWGLCLCAYGIEYVDDPASGEKKPTCHRTLPISIMEDSNFEQACDYADAIARRVYREEAKAIDRIQKDILSIVSSEKPYDVFICYKETSEEGGRTEDSVLAQDIYDALTEKGLKVFFAKITLEDKLGQQYEPFIYAALSSAKVMLAVGTKFEYYDSVWVKNEWMRFLSMMKTDKKKVLIPCYKDLDAYDMPKEMKNLQAQDMGKIGWMQDLIRGILKLVRPEEKKSNIPDKSLETTDPMINNLLTRANLFLEQKEQEQAQEYFNKVLDKDPHNVDAYIGLLLAECYLTKPEQIRVYPLELSDHKNFKNALRFADEETKEKLNEYVTSRDENFELTGPFYWYFDCAKMGIYWKDCREDMWEPTVREQVQFVAALFLAISQNKNKPTQPIEVFKALNYMDPSNYVFDGESVSLVKNEEITAYHYFTNVMLGYSAEKGHQSAYDMGFTRPILIMDYELHPKLDVFGKIIDIPWPKFNSMYFSNFTEAFQPISPEDVVQWAKLTEKVATVPELYCLISVIYYVFGVKAGDETCKDKAYLYAEKTLDSTESSDLLDKCETVFMGLSDYLDSKGLSAACKKKKEKIKKMALINELLNTVDDVKDECELDDLLNRINVIVDGIDIDISEYKSLIEIKRKKIQEAIRKEQNRQKMLEEQRAELTAKLNSLEQQLVIKKKEINALTGFFSKNKRNQAEQEAEELMNRIQGIKYQINRLS